MHRIFTNKCYFHDSVLEYCDTCKEKYCIFCKKYCCDFQIVPEDKSEMDTKPVINIPKKEVEQMVLEKPKIEKQSILQKGKEWIKTTNINYQWMKSILLAIFLLFIAINVMQMYGKIIFIKN